MSRARINVTVWNLQFINSKRHIYSYWMHRHNHNSSTILRYIFSVFRFENDETGSDRDKGRGPAEGNKSSHCKTC